MTAIRRARLLIRLRPVILLLPVALPGGVALFWQRGIQAWIAFSLPAISALVLAVFAWIFLTTYCSMCMTTKFIPYRRKENPLWAAVMLILTVIFFAAYWFLALEFAGFIAAHERYLLPNFP